jgi:hypothetical protein
MKKISGKMSVSAPNSISVRKEITQILKASKQLKWYNTSGPSSVSTSIAFAGLSGIPAGVTNGQRVGTSVDIERILLNGQWVIGDTTQIVRVLVFKWNVDNTSDTPQSSEIFDFANDPLAPMVQFKPKRFKMLFDHIWTMDTYHPTELVRIDIKVKIKQTFDIGVNTGINNVYLALISDSGAVPNPTFTWDSQVWYTDTE